MLCGLDEHDKVYNNPITEKNDNHHFTLSMKQQLNFLKSKIKKIHNPH